MANRKLAEAVTSVLTYYRQDVSPALLGVWLSALEDVEVEQVVRALNAHVKDPDRGQYPPKVADVVRAIQGTTTDRAAIAWSVALESAARVGAYRDVVFDDPAIHAAIHDVGGWPILGRTRTQDLGYLQSRFVTSYRAYAQRTGYEYPRTCHGDRDPDSEYEKKGLHPPAPALIGDPKACRLVLDGKCWRSSKAAQMIEDARHDLAPVTHS